MHSLKVEEVSWNLKSRALWLEKGDINTKYIHRYANHRRMINSIWDLESTPGVCLAG